MSTVATLDMDIRSPESDSPLTDRLDLYQLTEVNLTHYAALVVPATSDQEHLARHRGVLHHYLERGGVVIFGGHLHRDWLPGASPFVPLARPSLSSYRVTEVAEHPIFVGVDPDDLTYRRGVAGFFARGHHPPPEGAEVLTRLAGGEPATYVDQVSTAGTIVVHASADLLGYPRHQHSTASRIPTQLLKWAVQKSRIVPDRPDAAEPAAESAALLPMPRSAGGGLVSLYGGSAAQHRTLTAPKYAPYLDGGLIYLPELADTDLTRYAGLVLPERLHRGLLTAGAHRILELLDAGGTVIAFSGGEPLPEFLPGVRWEHRPTNFWWWLEPGADLGLRTPLPDHALFGHLGLPDCTWHYHGVLDPPEDAEVLVTLPTGEALLYVDRTSTPGTLVVATLDPISHYGSYFMPATERFLDGFLPWAATSVAQQT